MPVSAAERRFILDNLTRLAEADIRKLWRLAERQSDTEFAAYVVEAFPQVVDPYHQMAAQASATFFEEDFPNITDRPLLAPPLPTEQLAKSAQWALAADGVQAISRMSGTAQRAVYNGDRDTTVANVGRQGMRWVRVARPNACAFCRLVASRAANGETYSGSGVALKIDPKTMKLDPKTGKPIPGTGRPFADKRKTTVVYGRRRTDAKQQAGREYHDFCHCTAKAIPGGVDPVAYLESTEPEFAAQAQQWNDEYNKAVADAGSGDTKAILSAWRKQEGVEVYVPKPKAAKFDRAMLDNADSVDVVGKYINGKHGIKVDQLVDSPLSKGVPIDDSLKRGVDVISAAKAAKPRVIDARTAREFGQAVDDVLIKYPYLTLDEIKGDFYPAGNPLSSEAHARMKLDANGKADGGQYVALNALSDVAEDAPGTSYALRQQLARGEGRYKNYNYDNRYKAATIDRQVYAVMIHEMGHVVDFNSGTHITGITKAQYRAFQAIREHILATPEAVALRAKVFAEKPGAMERLYGNRFEITPEFEELEKNWIRENLVSAYSFKDSDRDKGVYWTEALAEAFADVELRGEQAETASRIIHKAMVDAAEEYRVGK